MIDRTWDWLARLGHYWEAATTALDGAGMTLALVLFAAILAAAGGMFSARMRLYGALVGAMLVNAMVKAMGGGFGAALAAMIVTTLVAFALGSTLFLLRLLKARKLRG